MPKPLISEAKVKWYKANTVKQRCFSLVKRVLNPSRESIQLYYYQTCLFRLPYAAPTAQTYWQMAYCSPDHGQRNARVYIHHPLRRSEGFSNCDCWHFPNWSRIAQPCDRAGFGRPLQLVSDLSGLRAYAVLSPRHLHRMRKPEP